MDREAEIKEEIDLVRSLKENDKKKKKKKKPKLDETKIYPEEKLPAIQGEQPENLALRKLRSRLRPLASHPVYGPKLDGSDGELRKWLRSSKGNVYMAACKLRKYLSFRKEMDVDNLLDNYFPPDVLLNHYPGGLCGEDRQGCPVAYEILGCLDCTAIMRSVSREDMQLFRLYQYERIIKHLKRLSFDRQKRIDSILVVIDMAKANVDLIWSPSLFLWKEALHLLRNYYPGLVKEIVVIRPSPMFAELYASLRPYIGRSGDLVNIRVLGYRYFRYLKELIAPHNIPAFLGGYKCDYDNDPFCRTWLNWPRSKIQAWQFFTDIRMAADVINRKVGAGCAEFHELNVAQPRTMLIWEIFNMSHPFMFTVYKDRMLDEKCAVFRTTRMFSGCEFCTHAVMCEEAGRYFLYFDNWKNLAEVLHVVYRVDPWLPPSIRGKLREQEPLGDTFDMSTPVGPREKILRDKYYFEFPPPYKVHK